MQTSSVLPVVGDDPHPGNPSVHVSQRPETDTSVQLRPKTASISPHTAPERDAALHNAAKHLSELLCHKERTKMQRALDHWYLKLMSDNLQVSAQASRVSTTSTPVPSVPTVAASETLALSSSHPSPLRSAVSSSSTQETVDGRSTTALGSTSLLRRVHIYTDGACKGNAGARSNSKLCDAGWAAIVYLNHQHVKINQPSVSLFGPVVSPRAVMDRPSLADFALGADANTNNSSELSAIVETFLWLQEHPYERVTVWTDSEYSLNMLKQRSSATSRTSVSSPQTWHYQAQKNVALVLRARSELLTLRANGCQIDIRHVYGHTGHPGNDRADSLATRGSTGEICSVGRWKDFHECDAATSSTPEGISTFPLPCNDDNIPLDQRQAGWSWTTRCAIQPSDRTRVRQGCPWFTSHGQAGNASADATVAHGVPIRFQPANPKQVGSHCHTRYARYFQASTTGELFQIATSKKEATKFYEDLVHDIGKGYAHIYLPTFVRPPPSARNQRRRQGNLRSTIIRTRRSEQWPTRDLPGSPASDPLPETRAAARLLAQDECKKVVVSFTFLHTADGLAAAAAVEALRSPSSTSSSSRPRRHHFATQCGRVPAC